MMYVEDVRNHITKAGPKFSVQAHYKGWPEEGGRLTGYTFYYVDGQEVSCERDISPDLDEQRLNFLLSKIVSSPSEKRIRDL